MVHRYLASYRAAPQKTTGKSPYELMFNRKMMTKLPQLPIMPNKKFNQEVREMMGPNRSRSNMQTTGGGPRRRS